MPTDLLKQFTDAIGSFFDNEAVQFGLRAVFIYIVVVWLAAAYWAFRDMQARTENPILPYMAAAFVILFTPILFPFAVVIYRVVRPQERLGEVYERNLAEEAMLAEVEAIRSCPGCGRRVHDEWIICPTCRTRLNRVCPNCGKLVGLDWSLCAWCGKDFERRDLVPERVTADQPRRTMHDVGEGSLQPRPTPRPAPAPVEMTALPQELPAGRLQARRAPRQTAQEG